MTDGAYIVDVVPESPADDAGFTAGCRITSVEGQPLRDVIDWRWLASEDEAELAYIDTDGDSGTIELQREPGEDWGFVFDGAVFDAVRTCRNACTFCFMRQLPPAMRPSLTMRDDDFRLSFLSGTFVTLTNLTEGDIERITCQRISPLRVSLHAVDSEVRRALIGRHAQDGLDNLQRLLEAGIQFDAQVVLVPDVNDDKVLDETLAWAYGRPGIRTVGIVPLGFTRYQDDFSKSFDDPADARAVIEQTRRFQARALAERGTPWVYAADEFYRNAYGERVLDEIPEADFYGEFDMYQDGIGIIRSAADDFRAAVADGAAARAGSALDTAGAGAVYLTGEAMQPYCGQLVAQSPGLAGRLVMLPVKNRFFGGNVNVTGLLTGQDIADAIARDAATRMAGSADGAADVADSAPRRWFYLVPSVVFNADGRTLDDWTLDDIKAALAPEIADAVSVASTNPIDYLQHIATLAQK